jgi:predicted type IV restriction endonuclease
MEETKQYYLLLYFGVFGMYLMKHPILFIFYFKKKRGNAHTPSPQIAYIYIYTHTHTQRGFKFPSSTASFDKNGIHLARNI